MQELLVSKLSRNCVMGANLIDKQYASRCKLAKRAMCTLMICELKMWPSFPPNECTAHRVCAKEPRLVINNAYRSCLGQCRLVTRRGKLLGLDALCTPCQPLIIDQFWFFTLPQSVMGRSDCSIIKTSYFGFPPSPIFSKYFFFGPRPSLQKITNANTNTNEDRKDDLHIFHRKMITNLTPCWQLVTPCWQFVDTLLTIVQV